MQWLLLNVVQGNGFSITSTAFAYGKFCLPPPLKVRERVEFSDQNMWNRTSFNTFNLMTRNQTVHISNWIKITIISGVTASLTCCSSMLFFSTGSTVPTGDRINDCTKPSCTHILPRQMESHRMSSVSEKRNDCCGNPCNHYWPNKVRCRQ